MRSEPWVDDAHEQWDTAYRDRDGRTDDLLPEERSVFSVPPRARRNTGAITVGERCPGCAVVCARLDVEHLDGCFYQGKMALVLVHPDGSPVQP